MNQQTLESTYEQAYLVIWTILVSTILSARRDHK
jgi:hypothetical protein